jgi:hypothetical protein
MTLWTDALRKWNEEEENDKWCMPRKGSTGHAQVLAIMKRMKARVAPSGKLSLKTALTRKYTEEEVDTLAKQLIQAEGGNIIEATDTISDFIDDAKIDDPMEPWKQVIRVWDRIVAVGKEREQAKPKGKKKGRGLHGGARADDVEAVKDFMRSEYEKNGSYPADKYVWEAVLQAKGYAKYDKKAKEVIRDGEKAVREERGRPPPHLAPAPAPPAPPMPPRHLFNLPQRMDIQPHNQADYESAQDLLRLMNMAPPRNA